MNVLSSPVLYLLDYSPILFF